MTWIILRRLLALPIVLLATSVIVFSLAWISPYDPSQAYVMAYGPDISRELREQYEAAWGLDRPAHEQYISWIQHTLKGDLGNSRLLAGQPVAEVLLNRAWPTLLLVGTALIVVLVGGLVAGVLAAWFKDSWIDWLIRTSAYSASFAPSFWIALIAIYVFAFTLNVLPAGGMSDFRADSDLRLDIRYLILPTVTLALTQHGWFTLYVRNTMIEVMREDYVKFAEAQGFSQIRVVFKHVLPNALIPFVTLIGTHIPELIGGSVLIESIFGWPGLGNLTRQAAISVDLPLLLAIVMLGAVMVVFGNLLSDLLYRVLDPRVREIMR